MNRLSKEKLNSLIDDVIIPSEKMFISDERLDEHIKKMLLAEGLISKLALLPFNDETTQKSMLEDVDIFFKFVVKDETIFREILTNFYNLYVEWIGGNCPKIKNRLEHFEKYLIEDDGFFDFDSDERDEKLENMHYKEEEKIDAKTFMEQNDIDEAIILKLIRSMKRMKEVSKRYAELTDEYVEELFHNDEFIRVFQFSIEFRDIAYTLELLKLKLFSLDLNELSKQQRVILKTMMDGILSDLDDWIHQVLIDQTAQDIHYLDASLLANIAQMDVMLNSLEKSKEEDDDFELF